MNIDAKLAHFNIIPIIKNSKKPAIEWREYQSKKYVWNRNDWNGNFAIVCGQVSGNLVVVDIDSAQLYQEFFSDVDTFTVSTPSKGYHLYFRCSLDKTIHGYRGFPIDIQSSGSYVLIPPSRLGDGSYEVVRITDVVQADVTGLLDDRLPKSERPEGIADFKKRIRLGDVIKDYLPLMIQGKGYWQTLCPFHEETQPSFTVYNDNYYCFGCKAHGDVIDFIEEKEHLDFVDSVNFLCQKYHLASPLRKEGEYFDETGRPSRAKFVDAVMEKYHFATALDNDDLYIYEDNRYLPSGEQAIKTFVERIFRERGMTASESLVNETIASVKRRSYVDRKHFNPANLLNVNNGILDLDNKRLLPHDPRYLFDYCLPIAYDPQAGCPCFEQFLREVASEDNAVLLQEMFGYCLFSNNKFQTAFILVGSGCNGKSTLLNVLTSLLGKSNVSAESLQSIAQERFACASLVGKLANICADIPAKPLAYTGTFKELTGGDLIKAEQKFKPMFTFVNRAKLIFSANQLPQVDDSSIAFWRRWLVIEFPNSFEGREDFNLESRLMSELSGVLNFALDGYYRLLERNRFSATTTAKDIKEQWKREADSVYYFANERLERKVDSWITKEDLYLAYSEFCEQNNVLKYSKNELGRRVVSHMTTKTCYRQVEGRQKEAWLGIAFKTN